MAGPLVSNRLIETVFAGMNTGAFLASSGQRRMQMLREAECRFSGELSEISKSIEKAWAERQIAERKIVDDARLTLTTMASMYISPALIDQRYDTVIIEEAGMAVLPAVFYCASLARDQVLFVGDPRQLPPIVQSRDPYVRRAMGRSIFDVTVPEPETSAMVALLDTQYRMHPVIGCLISQFFYGGQVRDGLTSEDRDELTNEEPYPGNPLVLLDTGGMGVCRKQEGGFSRYNEETGRLCVDLATRAVGSVAIITPYVEHSKRIRILLNQKRLNDVECRTIHRFQGGERDVVIFDMVDCPPLPPGKLLSGDGSSGDAGHLLNVSFSRARGKLIVLADVSYFRESGASALVSDLLHQLSQLGKVVDGS